MKKIDKMEEDIGRIVDKIETSLLKMASVEKTRSTKLESMNRILDTIIDDSDGRKFQLVIFPHYFWTLHFFQSMRKREGQKWKKWLNPNCKN